MRSFSTYFIVDYFTDFELNWMVLLIPGVSWSSWLLLNFQVLYLHKCGRLLGEFVFSQSATYVLHSLRFWALPYLMATILELPPKEMQNWFYRPEGSLQYTLYLIVANRIFWLVLLWNSDLTVTMPYVRGTEKLEVQLEQANLVSFANPGHSKCYVTYNKWGLGDEVPNMVCYTLSPGVKHFRPPARALSRTHSSFALPIWQYRS